MTTKTLAELVAKWRNFGLPVPFPSETTKVRFKCADELEAALSQQPAVDEAAVWNDDLPASDQPAMDSAIWIDSRALERLAKSSAVQVNLYRYKPARRYDRQHIQLFTHPATGPTSLPPLPVEAAGYSAGCNQALRVGDKLFTAEQMREYATAALHQGAQHEQ